MMHNRIAPVAISAVLTALLAAALGVRAQTEEPVPAAALPIAPIFYLSSSPGVPVAGDPVTLTAAPQNFPAASTTFTWFRDGVELNAASGIGRNTTVIATDGTRGETLLIRVVADPGPGFATGEATLALTTLPNPEVREREVRSISSGFTLEVSNRSPAPGETIEARVVTFAFDKDRASYQWRLNGALDRARSGLGSSTFTFAAGRNGEVKTVSVTVETPSGEVRERRVTVRAVSVPFYWWADTTVPHWYKGKALPSTGSRITVLALPDVAGAGGLTYRWQFNDSVVPAASGAGRNTFSFTFALPAEERVSVTMRDAAGTLDKTADIGISPAEPVAAIYEARPLRGVVFERRLAGFAAPSGEPYDFIAVPFFFPATANLSYRWSLNGSEVIGQPPDPWRFVLTSKPNAPASDLLGVTVEDQARRAVRALASLAIQLR